MNVDVRAIRRGVPAGVLWGALGVAAWAGIAVLFGGGAAHADESDDNLLSPITSLVGDTVSAATEPLAPVVTQIVAPVVTQVVAPVQQTAPAVVAPVVEVVTHAPVVGTVAAPVVQETATTVEAVVTPVTELLGDDPVSQIAAPVVEVVAGLPVVGDLTEDLGVIDLVGTVIGVVDDAAAVIGTVTDETVPPVLEVFDPEIAGPTPLPPVITPDVPVGSSVIGDASPVSGATSAVSASRVAWALGAAVHPTVTGADSASGSSSDDPGRAFSDGSAPSETPSDGPPAAPVAPSSSAGSGGASSYAHARLSDVGVSLLLGSQRSPGASDDVLPSSPVADTDVSPD